MTEIQLKIDQLDVPIELLLEQVPTPYSNRREYSEERIRKICEEYVQPFTVSDLRKSLSAYGRGCLSNVQVGAFLSKQSWVIKEGRRRREILKDGRPIKEKKQTFYRVVTDNII